MSGMTLEFIFVYGTLRKKSTADIHPLLTDLCTYYSDGIMRGKLYALHDYPGAVESCAADDKVYGELYSLFDSKRILARLDDYEECSSSFPLPHEYIRKQRPIEPAGGGLVTAWVYLYQHDVSRLKQILSGDYLAG